jgi:GT2 family glycosyltransferase
MIAAGIVLFNTPLDAVERLIRSISAAASVWGGNCRVYIIDNSDKPLNLRDLNSQVESLPSVGNVGFGRAHNLLMSRAFQDNAEGYLAINPDGLLHPRLLEAMDKRMRLTGGQALIEARQFPNEHPKVYDKRSLETQWCSGACLLISRAIWDLTSGFDDGFFMYCEDVDLSWRVRASGRQCLIAADAIFFHDVVGRSQSDFARWHMTLSMQRLVRRWSPRTPQKLLAHLKAELENIPESERLRGSSDESEELWRNIRFNPADFDHFYGFSEFRWK